MHVKNLWQFRDPKLYTAHTTMVEDNTITQHNTGYSTSKVREIQQ